MPLTPGSRLGPYEIVGKLGEGGMGEVYRATDTNLARQVAIKVLPEAVAQDPERLTRFDREAKTLAALNHPNIAHIHGLERTGGTIALVMELVEGQTLADRIARGRIPIADALPIAKQIVEALEAAHAQHIIHRDLKPANIKVRDDGTVKVLDFGLAKALDSADPSSANASMSPTIASPAMTHTGMILGTAAYMAPEQARGKPVDSRADIWAFGCVVYEMLTARQPFAGETVSDSIAAILGRDPNFNLLPPETPASIQRLLRRCLVRDPRARLHHIADARLDLDDAGSSGGAIATSSPSPSRRRDVAAAALAGAAMAGIAVYVGLRAIAPTAAPTSPLQLAVPMPAANSAANGLLVSPDGRYLVTRGPNGASVLHSLDGAPSRPLLEFTAQCWSPDSRSLVLQRSNGELLKMNLGGGAPVAFATTSSTAAGCTWNNDGVLLIDEDGRSLKHVVVSNGSVTPMELEDGGEDARRSSPRFLPDGTHFIYWAVSADGQWHVRAGALGSRSTTVVVASDAPAVYNAGYLLYQRGATLVAQPFDERTRTLSGEPRALTSETASGSVLKQTSYDVSEAGMLVFATTNGGVKGQQVWFDRSGNVLGTVPQPNGAELLNLALSPDGTQVLGNRMDPSTGNWDIWLVDLRSGAPTRLTTDAGVDSDAVWSPDGAEIAYVSQRRGAPGIYRRSIATGREALLLKSSAAVVATGGLRTTDWSPDGRFIVYEAANNILALPLADVKTPLSVVVGPELPASGKVSPDGRWMAFHSTESGEEYIYVQPFPGPGPRTRVSVEPGRHPRWRRDGGELFWTFGVARGSINLRTLHSAELTFTGSSVRASAPKPALPPFVNIAPLVDNRGHAAIAADGQRFLLRQADGPAGPAVKVILHWQEMLQGAR